MASIISQAIPQSSLPLCVKNTFIDIEDDATDLERRRSSSEPPSCRHGDKVGTNEFGFKRGDNDDLSESTASGCGSPRLSVSDSTSDDGVQHATVTSPVAKSTLNPDAAVWSPTWRPTLHSGTSVESTPPEPKPPATPEPCLPLTLLSLELSMLAMIPACFQEEFEELFKSAELAFSKSDLVRSTQMTEGSGEWGDGVRIVGSIGPKAHWQDKEKLLKSVQQALLEKAEMSESVYVMGYSLKPFTTTEDGFAAMLGGMKDDGWACWDMLTKGFCSKGSQCCKQHPSCMIPIYVDIVEERRSRWK